MIIMGLFLTASLFAQESIEQELQKSIDSLF